MSLNPSCNNVDGVGLPVLGDPPFSACCMEVAKAELLKAFPEATFDIQEETRQVFRKGTKGDQMGRCGICMAYEGQEEDIETVTMYRVEASLLGWRFRRAWYYWTCSTSDRPVPEKTAFEFNSVFGSQVRVDGFAGGTSVDGDVSRYHVDTLAGLMALVALLRRIPRPGDGTNAD